VQLVVVVVLVLLLGAGWGSCTARAAGGGQGLGALLKQLEAGAACQDAVGHVSTNVLGCILHVGLWQGEQQQTAARTAARTAHIRM
jgi:hypothetical protein